MTRLKQLDSGCGLKKIFSVQDSSLEDEGGARMTQDSFFAAEMLSTVKHHLL